MEKIRKIGIGLVCFGVALAIGAWIFFYAGVGPTAFFILVAPPMIAMGVVMIAAPGDPHGHHDLDFADWFELLPTGRRVMLYLINLVALGIGCLVLLYFAEWTLEGVILLLM